MHEGIESEGKARLVWWRGNREDCRPRDEEGKTACKVRVRRASQVIAVRGWTTVIGRDGFLFGGRQRQTSNAKERFGPGVSGHTGHASTGGGDGGGGGGMRQGLGWHIEGASKVVCDTTSQTWERLTEP